MLPCSIQGLLRVREFTMAEIEHFVKPDMKQHPRFSNIAHRKARLFPADNQVGDGRVVTDLTFGDAVATGVIDNETLAYFIARVEMFLQRVGIDAERLRFRQHLPTEMAHYATDCWDAEIQTSYGYVQHTNKVHACRDEGVGAQTCAEFCFAGVAGNLYPTVHSTRGVHGGVSFQRPN